MLIDFFEEMKRKNAISYEKDVLLSKKTFFGIGGCADYAVYPKNLSALKDLLAFLKSENERYILFGNASNVLFDDNGFRGTVIFTKDMDSYRFDGNILTADAGASLIRLSLIAAKRSLSGLEFACSIPGSVGGAVYMNAGAYGSDMSHIVSESYCLDEDLNEKTVKDHCFSYRDSVYRRNSDIITGCRFVLEYSDKDEIEAKMNENRSKRKASQPYNEKSAGSVFKRLEKSEYPVSMMIDMAGLKGLSVGGAKVSEKHAGFIVNYNNASAEDVKKLIEIIKSKVFDKFGVIIETEIIIANE